jgi:hypothetical protein
MQPTIRYRGVIAKVLPSGRAFIHPDHRPLVDHAEDAYVAPDDFDGGRLAEGLIVTYEPVAGRDGKMRARHVRVAPTLRSQH